MTGDRYIQSVIDHVPHGMAPRDHIALELRGHIAERTAQGQPLDEVLRQLGDPLTLAESYLAAIPLMNAGLMARLAAKVVDAAIFLAPAAALVVLVRAGRLPPGSGLFLLSIFGSVVAFLAYIVIAEHRLGWTLGKRLMGLRVVRESGARISLGQSLLRQVPFIGQFFFIDALFALFTERRQRAFELLTKTRTIALLICIGVLAPDAGVVHAPGKQGLSPDDYLRMTVDRRTARALPKTVALQRHERCRPGSGGRGGGAILARAERELTAAAPPTSTRSAMDHDVASQELSTGRDHDAHFKA